MGSGYRFWLVNRSQDKRELRMLSQMLEGVQSRKFDLLSNVSVF